MDRSRPDNVTLPSPSTHGEMAARRRGAEWARARVGQAMSRPVLTIDAAESLGLPVSELPPPPGR